MTGFIDYEAAWKEIKDKEWKENSESKYRYHRLCKLEAKYTIPPGTPLTPRQAWAAAAKGYTIQHEEFKAYVGTNGVLCNVGETPANVFYVRFFDVVNSGQAVIVEEISSPKAPFGDILPQGLKIDGVCVNPGDTKPVVDRETASGERQILTPRCDGCAWGHEPHEDIWECRWDTYCNSHRADYWCSHFLPADRSQMRCETCKNWTREGNNVLHGSECLEDPYGVSKLATSTCGRWAVIPPAWADRM
jgi:hypothetical protein